MASGARGTSRCDYGGIALTPMEPIPETVLAAEELRRLDSDSDLVERLTALAARAQAVVPTSSG